MIKISKFLDENLISFISANNRDDVLQLMVDTLYRNGTINNREVFHHSIMEREKIISTSIGMGVAIPHAKLNSYDDFFISVAILSKGVDWNSLDGSLVRIVFMIGGPDNKQTEYLQILSGITHAIKDENKRKKMLTLNSQQDMMAFFKGF